MIRIREIKTKRELNKFVDFQYKLYANNKYWVPPLRYEEINTLRQDKNPAYEFCEAKYWIAYSKNKIVGRIAGIINHKYNEIWGEKSARFGWIDFIDDENVSKALLEAVEMWAAQKGMTSVHGPMGFCGMDKEGALVEGFEEMSTISTLYNFSYYSRHFEKLGYEKDIDWVEYELKVPDVIPEKVDRISDVVLKRSKLRIADFKKAKELLPYGKALFELINDAYKDLAGAIPLSEKQIQVYIKQYFSFVSTEYIKIILDENNNMAAFGIAMPSLTEAFRKAGGRLFPFGFIHILKAIKKNDRLDLYLVAVRPDLQSKGINAILMNEINKACLRNGIVMVESGSELEDNLKVQAFWKHYESRQHKRRRCYVKNLQLL